MPLMSVRFKRVLLAVVLLLQPHRGAAWWDQSHLLVATIARRLVSKPDAFDRLLQSEWQQEFANYSDLVNASLWADFIKCQAKVCEKGLPSLVSTLLFNGLHKTVIPYNPLNTSLSKLSGLVQAMPLGGNMDAVLNHGWIDGVTALADCDRSLRSTARHSSFAWHLQLRLVLHVMADLHQPFHTVSMFSPRYVEGDANGHAIQLDASSLPAEHAWMSGKTLHNLWDACGGLYRQRWPVPQDILERQADELLANHSREAFEKAGRFRSDDWSKILNEGYPDLKDNMFVSTATFFQSMAEDTASYMVEAYKEYMQEPDSDSRKAVLMDGGMASPPYKLSPEYIAAVRQMCGSQLVLAGLRLGTWLQSIEPFLPELHKEEGPTSGSNGQGESRTALIGCALGSFVLGAILGALIMGVFQSKLLRRKQDRVLAPVDDGGMEFSQMYGT